MACPKRISEKSALAVNSALNIFSVPSTNISIIRSHFREILPLSSVTQESPYLFRLFNDDLWSDLSRVYLFLELSIQQQLVNSTDWVPSKNNEISPVQLIGQTFVQQLKVQIGNMDVYDSGTLYPYKAYITNELSFAKNIKENFLSIGGYYWSDEHDNSGDEGFEKRCGIFKDGKKAQFMSRLDFDLGNQEMFFLNNMDILFTIYRSKDSFILQNLKDNDVPTTKYRLYLHNIKLFVKMLEIQPSLNLSIYKTLQEKPATYAVRRTEIKSAFISAGRTEIEHNIFSATIPRRLTICLVENNAFNGDLSLTPFNFKPHGIRDISVIAGGNNYPAVPYNNLDFPNGLCARPFVDFYEALSATNTNHSFDISLEKFQNGWCFFVIPLNSSLDDSCGFELLRSGTTTVRIQFNTAVPVGGLEMIVLGEFDQLIYVDFQRRVMADSNLS